MYPWLLIVIALAYLAGVVTMMQLGFKLPDSVNGLVGAAIGAVAGIGGALCVVLATDYVQGRNIAAYVLLSYEPALFRLWSVEGAMNRFDAESVERNWTNEQWATLSREIRAAIRAMDTSQARIRRVEPNVHRLKADALHISNRTEECAQCAKEALVDVIESQSEATRFYGGQLSEQLRARLIDATEALKSELLDLSMVYGMRRTGPPRLSHWYENGGQDPADHGDEAPAADASR